MSRTLCLLVVVAGLLIVGAPRAAMADEPAGDGNPRFTYEYMVKCFALTKKTQNECFKEFGEEHTYTCPGFEQNDGRSSRAIWRDGCFMDWVNEMGSQGWQLADASVNRLDNGVGGMSYPYNFIRIRVWSPKSEPSPAPDGE